MDIGGIERKIVDIANYYQPKIPTTLILRHRKGPLLSQLNPQINIIESGLYPPFLTLVLRKLRPSLILTFGNYCSICTILSSPFSKIIISEDSSIDLQIKLDTYPRLRQLLVRLTYPLATKIITLTTAGRKKLHALTKSTNITVLPNWLPLVFKPLKSTKKDIDILFLGRFVAQKNPLRFLQICQKLPQLNIAMVGSGILEPQIRQYITVHHLNVQLLPATTNPTEYYQRSKILLITSIHEGFPLTVLEALANKCLPVIKNIPEITSFFDYQSSRLIFTKNPHNQINYLLSHPKSISGITAYYQNKVLSEQQANFKHTINLIKNSL